jgi:hypothetical protein
MRLLLLLLLTPFPAHADLYGVAGAEHISSWFDGRPFNNRKEFSTDMVYAGVSWEENNWKVDLLVAHTLQNETAGRVCDTTQVYSNSVPVQRIEECWDLPSIEGSNPRAIFRIEKRFKIK